MKHFFLLLGTTTLFIFASCSGEGAYSEEEKKEQDSVDEKHQEADFEKLENQYRPKPGDTAAKSPIPDPLNNQQVAEPKVIIEAEEVK
ncbi:MAG: hypothetical protein FJ347_07315 [Sphingomonadales bacterium]|nr:hypothetical protein [Sphingomonadales bacterium]